MNAQIVSKDASPALPPSTITETDETSTSTPDEGAKKARSQAAALLDWVQGQNYFHTPDGKPYACLKVGKHSETHGLKSEGFRQYLAHVYFEHTHSALSDRAVRDVIGALTSKAMFKGPCHEVWYRVAEHAGAIYIDLGNENFEAVKITPNGWEIVPFVPVMFRRSGGMKALPTPIKGGTLADLRPFVNVKNENDFALVVAWILAAMRPHGPYPIMVIHGEHGSAKSTTSKVCRALTDPNTAPLRAPAKSERDFIIAANNCWVYGLDNLSHISDEMSDRLCRLTTGGGFGTRALYMDDDEALFNVTRTVLINGIEEIATRADMVDRSLIVNLPRIPDAQRKTEAEFWAKFNEAQPRILGALFTIVAGALSRLATVDASSLPRMSDFARWIIAAEPSTGWREGLFMRAYNANREESNDITLEASPIAKYTIELAHGKGWNDTSTKLLEYLNTKASYTDQRHPGWPKTARTLSNSIRRILPNLRTANIDAQFKRNEASHTRERLIILRPGS
jgi:hypothetical protein